ncbi:MAG: hypothetical protein JST31_05335 [Actinobacteria bacterium]|nr:hypothetical protein [Actinomycetota bacterium]
MVALLSQACSLAAFSPAGALGDTCPNEAFRTGLGANLPDCRAYERASPADKNGGSVEGFPYLLTAANDGSSVTYFTQAGTGIPASGGGTQDFSTYMSKREGEFWSTQRLMPPQSLGQEAHYLGATPDHHFAFVEASLEGTGPEAGRGLFMLDTSNGSVQTIVRNNANREEPPTYSAAGLYGYAIDGASTDGSRVLFETPVQLLPGATPGMDNLYLWSRDTSEITLAGVLPTNEGGGAPEGGSFGGAYDWFSNDEPAVGGAWNGLGVQALNAIGPGASQVVFTAGGTGQLYLRRSLNSGSPTSVRISAPGSGAHDPYVEAEGLEGKIPAAFQEATPDGSSVFFLSSQKLTADATTGSLDEGRDLYRWDAATGTLLDITPDANGETPNGAEVQGLLGVAENGTSGFFVARGVLASGAVPGGENLYRFEATTAPPRIEFVATLENGPHYARLPDVLNYSPRSYAPFFGEAGGVRPNADIRSSRVSADGRTVIFGSVRSLTGYNNHNFFGAECVFNEGQCGELFRYSVASGATGGGTLTCISCDSNGAPPVGSAHLESQLISGGAALPFGDPMVTFADNLSANGGRVFFESPDPLVPGDTNGASGCPAFAEVNNGPNNGNKLPACQDVYEWEAPGTPGGSCVKAEVSGGCLYLLSTGKSPDPSFFAGASAEGQAAFIVTSSQLVPEDVDTARDAYAVRVDGGLAAQFATAGRSCSGEGCLASPSGPPGAPGPGSASVEGPPNAKPKHKKHKQKKTRHSGGAKAHKHKKTANHDGGTHTQRALVGGKG